ncbi:MAG: hypothetical protein ACNYWU_10970 [Desulfobacterales bacterium]
MPYNQNQHTVLPVVNALSVDLDGTLLYAEPEIIPVRGKSGFRYLAESAAQLLIKISKIMPVVIATGRNALSVKRLTVQLPNVRFGGFVLENGFVVKGSLDCESRLENEWDFIIDLLPDWERLPGYENCLGLIPPENRNDPINVVRQILGETGKAGYVYSESRKIFIYPGVPNKMSGLHRLRIHPYATLGNDLNDLQMLKNSSCPVTLSAACVQIKNIVKEKNGYCSSLSSHAATEDMLAWTYNKLQTDFS